MLTSSTWWRLPIIWNARFGQKGMRGRGSGMVATDSKIEALHHDVRFAAESGHCSPISATSACVQKRTCALLPDRDHQSVEVSGNDQPGLAARQREHSAVLVG
jgi:hypothetical protein